MCKTFNLIGSLAVIKSHFFRHNIKEFNSLNKVITFQKNYFDLRQEIFSNHKSLIEKERSILFSEILQLDNTITTRKIEIERELRFEIDKLKQKLNELITDSTSIIKIFINYFKKRSIESKIRIKEHNFNSNVAHSIRYLVSAHTDKNNRYEYIDSHFMDAVIESSLGQIKELERIKRAIDEINAYIYGALGEQKVVKELENLPQGYYLINDFSFTFPTPIYNKQDNDFIKSIQIDHVLVSPSGVFLIETKNWSERSINNLSLRSPVRQIKRSNFAVFILLNDGIANRNLNIIEHHWGERKISIRNLIVLAKVKPNEEFQYVKILTIRELLSYIKYFKPIFSKEETQGIAYYLLNLLGKKTNGSSAQFPFSN